MYYHHCLSYSPLRPVNSSILLLMVPSKLSFLVPLSLAFSLIRIVCSRHAVRHRSPTSSICVCHLYTRDQFFFGRRHSFVMAADFPGQRAGPIFVPLTQSALSLFRWLPLRLLMIPDLSRIKGVVCPGSRLSPLRRALARPIKSPPKFGYPPRARCLYTCLFPEILYIRSFALLDLSVAFGVS